MAAFVLKAYFPSLKCIDIYIVTYFVLFFKKQLGIIH